MPEFTPGDRVEVDISAGILPGANPEPDWLLARLGAISVAEDVAR